MKANDTVDLVFITPHNFLYAQSLSRQLASDIIRSWWEGRERWKNASFCRRLWWRLTSWSGKFTFAINSQDDLDPSKFFSQWAIGWESVLGLYIKERDTTISLQERATKAMEEQVKYTKKMLDDNVPGEEWKNPKEEDDLDEEWEK